MANQTIEPRPEQPIGGRKPTARYRTARMRTATNRLHRPRVSPAASDSRIRTCKF